HPDAADAKGRDADAALEQFVRGARLSPGWLLDGQRDGGLLDLRRNAILQDGLPAGEFLQGDLAAFVVQLLKAIEAVPAVAHDLASLGHVAELLGKLEEAGFGSNDLLVLGHGGVLRCGQRTPSVRLSPDFFTAGHVRGSSRNRTARARRRPRVPQPADTRR